YQYVLVDNTAPVATLTNPPASSTINGAAYAVTGTATDANFATWAVEKRQLPSGAFGPVANGTTPISAGTFATINTTGGQYPDGSYEFRLTVTDAAGNTTTDLHTAVAVDNTRPTVSSASSLGLNWVNVVFSESIGPTSVNSSYFTIPGLTVTGAVLQADQRTVQLTTSNQTAGTSNYTVTVKNTAPTITDLAGNILGLPDTAVFSGTTTLPAPAVPSGAQAFSGNGQDDISWTANTEAYLGGYNVYRDISAGGAFTTKVNSALIPAGTTSLTDAGYGSAGVYYYKVTAVNTTGGESAKSAAVSADTVRMSAVVGSAGATLTSSTGEAKLVIPAGALGGNTPIQVNESAKPADLPTLTFYSPTYDLLPAGQAFGANVTLTLDETAPGSSELDAKLYYYDLGTTKWVAAEGGSTVDTAGHKVAGSMNHFTQFAVGVFSATPPAVVSVNPVNNATGVAVTSFVAITFTLPMDPNAADWTRFQIRQAGTAIAIRPPVLSADHKTVYLYPRQMLEINTAYTVFVSATALGENGATLGADFTSTFTTSATGVSPHGAYTQATNLCVNCHAVHGAATASTGGFF
ncbi:MAG: Ig-like domain-containing protein, partial [Actinobacteria bacterium]|nr:Ig-like domain-containing protein [Actinomycetota bacterium]